MSLLSSLLSLIAPHECLGCSAEGRLLCKVCRSGLSPALSRCFRCQTPSDSFSTCRLCRQRSSLDAVYAACRYDTLAKDIVWKLKFGRAASAADELAAMMAAALPRSLPKAAIITYVPTATSRVRQRGYDQAALVARSLARSTGSLHTPLLVRTNQRKQVGASRAQRMQQLQGAFRPVARRSIAGKHILLVDDVLTTGSTLQVAASVLRRAGAARVEAAVFAQA